MKFLALNKIAIYLLQSLLEIKCVFIFILKIYNIRAINSSLYGTENHVYNLNYIHTHTHPYSIVQIFKCTNIIAMKM